VCYCATVKACTWTSPNSVTHKFGLNGCKTLFPNPSSDTDCSSGVGAKARWRGKSIQKSTGDFSFLGNNGFDLEIFKLVE
jgi:hypothetical protein